MTRAKAGRQRQRGAIDELPSGALRVRVHGGTDPVSGKRNTLVEIVEPGPKQTARADAARTRLLNQVDEQRSPRTSATLDQLLDRYLETLDVGRTTHRMYTRYLEKHVRPFLGRTRLARSAPRRWTRSTPSCAGAGAGAGAGTTVPVRAGSTTGPRASTTAMTAAGLTRAARSRRPRSGTSTSS